MPLRMVASLMRRSLFQLVAVGRLVATRRALDALPVVASFVGFRAPGRDDASFVAFCVRIDQRNFQPVYHTNRGNAIFAVIETVVRLFDGWTFENSRRIRESYAVQSKIAAILTF